MSVYTIPRRWSMGPLEDLPLALDAGPLLTNGETVTAASPTATLIDLATGASYAAGLHGSASVSGTTFVQYVHSLLVGHHYQLDITGADSAGRTWTLRLNVDCE